MGATASYPSSGALLPVMVHAAHKMVSEIQDFQKKDNAVFQMAQDLEILKGSDLGYAEIRPHITTNNLTATPFGKGTTLPTTIPELFGATRYQYANYASPVQFDFVQLEEAGGYEEQIPVIESTMYLAAQATGNTFEQDIVWGNSADPLRMLGLEQFITPTAAVANDLSTLNTTAELLAVKRWALRQSTNTVGGTTRAAWTSATTGGTGFENLSLNWTTTTAGTFGFAATTANQLNNACLGFAHVYNLTRQGVEFPDVILSTQKPFEDAAAMGTPFIQVSRQDAADSTINWGFGGIRYRQADWYWTESVAASGLNGNAAAGDDMIYMINASQWGIVYSNRWFCNLTPTVYSNSPLGAGSQMVTRLQQIHAYPGLCSVIYKYA